MRIRLPSNLTVAREYREPGEPVVSTHLCVIETILTVAPGAEDQQRVGIGIRDKMCPVRRHDNSIAGYGFDGDAATGIVVRMFLTVDDRAAMPDFKQLRG